MVSVAGGAHRLSIAAIMEVAETQQHSCWSQPTHFVSGQGPTRGRRASYLRSSGHSTVRWPAVLRPQEASQWTPAVASDQHCGDAPALDRMFSLMVKSEHNTAVLPC